MGNRGSRRELLLRSGGRAGQGNGWETVESYGGETGESYGCNQEEGLGRGMEGNQGRAMGQWLRASDIFRQLC